MFLIASQIRQKKRKEEGEGRRRRGGPVPVHVTNARYTSAASRAVPIRARGGLRGALGRGAARGGGATRPLIADLVGRALGVARVGAAACTPGHALAAARDALAVVTPRARVVVAWDASLRVAGHAGASGETWDKLAPVAAGALLAVVCARYCDAAVLAFSADTAFAPDLVTLRVIGAVAVDGALALVGLVDAAALLKDEGAAALNALAARPLAAGLASRLRQALPARLLERA